MRLTIEREGDGNLTVDIDGSSDQIDNFLAKWGELLGLFKSSTKKAEPGPLLRVEASAELTAEQD